MGFCEALLESYPRSRASSCHSPDPEAFRSIRQLIDLDDWILDAHLLGTLQDSVPGCHFCVCQGFLQGPESLPAASRLHVIPHCAQVSRLGDDPGFLDGDQAADCRADRISDLVVRRGNVFSVQQL